MLLIMIFFGFFRFFLNNFSYRLRQFGLRLFRRLSGNFSQPLDYRLRRGFDGCFGSRHDWRLILSLRSGFGGNRGDQGVCPTWLWMRLGSAPVLCEGFAGQHEKLPGRVDITLYIALHRGAVHGKRLGLRWLFARLRTRLALCPRRVIFRIRQTAVAAMAG